MIGDLHFALRRLARAPGFSATVVLLLGLALGANACVFSVLYGLLYKPLPFADAGRIVALDSLLANRGITVGLPVPYLEAARARTRTLDALAGYRARTIRTDADDAQAPSYEGALVQPEIFTLLGARPALGRLIAAEDTRNGAANSAVIGWDLWQNRYGGAADVLDKQIRLADGDYRIVGVLPRTFGFPRSTTQLWLPLKFTDAERAPDQAGAFSDLTAIGHLRPHASVAAAAAELQGIARDVEGLREIVDLIGYTINARPLRELWLGERRPALELMLLAVTLVLLVAVANVCNLHIARLLLRRQELALLDALGASPWRRLRQTIAETLALCLSAAVLGIAAIPPGLQLLRRFDMIPADAPQYIGVDAVTVVFIVALAALLALVMAASAVWLQGRNLALAMRSGGGTHTPGRGAQRARQTLIVAQIALTAALLASIGLLLRSSQRLLAEDVGFERDRLAISAIADLPRSQPGAPRDAAADEAATAAMRTFVERGRALPGVAAFGLGSLAPFGWSMSVSNFALPGQENSESSPATANRAWINADYFAALGAPLLRGRAFTPEETRSRADVVIVDTHFVEQVLAGRDPLGQKILLSVDSGKPMREVTIVGVVPTLKMQALDETAQRPSVYQPDEYPLNGMLLVRTQVDPATLAGPLRELFHGLAPRARLRDVVPIRERIAETVRDRERLNALLELLGVIALALAAVGLYAVLAYSVRMRTAEFGVRMALGAKRGRVLAGVLGQGTRLLATGLLLALPLVAVLARALQARLYRVGAFDPLTLGATVALLGAVALLASWLPARRAARVDPIEALRYE